MIEMKAALRELAGRELVGVSFVQDYVEFHWDGAVLRALSLPKVKAPGGVVAQGAPGWRDALCSFIGMTAQSIVVEENVRLEISFTGAEPTLFIPLDIDSMSAPERIHLMMQANEPWMLVW